MALPSILVMHSLAFTAKARMTVLAHRLFFALRLDALITKVAHRFGVGVFITTDMTCSQFFDFESPARVKVVVASVMQPTAVYLRRSWPWQRPSHVLG